MRTIFTLCGLILLGGGLFIWHAMQLPTHYGTFTSAPRPPVAQVIAHPQDFAGKTIILDGKITEQCKSMGCFFFFTAGNQTLRVDLQSIAMTAPMREGHRVQVQGEVVPFGDGYQLYASAVEFE